MAASDLRSPSPPTREAYRSQAGLYDQRTRTFQHWRDLVVDRLPVQPGDTVLDVGCGTGLCLSLLQKKVGPAGTIVGIDESEDMLHVAADRVSEHNWANVHLLATPVDQAPIDAAADAVVFCAVHDVMQSRSALAHVFEHVKPGGVVAAVGGKWPPLWMWPLWPWAAELHRPYIHDFTGFAQPWQQLTEFVPDLHVQHLASGAGYLAVGHTRSTPA